MSLETAKKCIDWIFENVPLNMQDVEISFIGGEPLFEFELMKNVFEYTHHKNIKNRYIFFASTNGTLLTDEMKQWFKIRKSCFHLGLSLDGTKETHNHNRSNSFDMIDIDFFKNTWPDQPVKMTLSEYSLHNLAANIKYIHSLGFQISGSNLSEGDFDWSKEEYIEIIVPQLKELVSFYVENDTLPLSQIFDRNLDLCEAKDKKPKKWCGIGNSTYFFDVDGKMYPCSFITPMTFSKQAIDMIGNTDFAIDNNFVDDDCFNNCYVFPICNNCVASNYMTTNSFKKRDKRKCKLQKLIMLFSADLHAKRIQNNPCYLDGAKLYYTIEAIKKINENYLDEFTKYL
jgi:radical SAM protein with 4Fe4S-binding SPASM domain